MNTILDTINETMHLNRLQGATSDKVKNSFFSNYLAALVLLRLQDLKGLMLINDPYYSKLTKFSNTMSDVNFWARAMFYPSDKDVKSRLVDGPENLSKCASCITDVRIQKMMKVPLTSPDQIDWDEVIGSLLLLKYRFNLKSSYFNNIIAVLHKWDDVSDSSKKRAVNQVFMYLMQSDPQSVMLNRIRALSSSTMIGGLNKIAQKIIGFRKLSEDGEGATSVGAIASTGANAIVTGKGVGITDSSTSSTDMQNVLAGLYKLKKKAPLQVTKKSGVVFKDGKIIKRKVKTFVARKFKAPDYLKVIKKQGDK